MQNTIVPILESKIPGYIQEQYPRFVEFFRDYLTWLESDGNFLQILNDWRQNNEPSLSVEPYVTAILKDMGFESGQGLKVRKEVMIHILRDLYLARGTEASFRLLFRTLFDADVEIRYPREQLFVPSAAEFGERFYVFTSASNLNSSLFQGYLDYIRENGGQMTGVISDTKAAVEDITIVYGTNGPMLKIETLRPDGEFDVGEQVIINAGGIFSEVVSPTLEIQIEASGSGYQVGERVLVSGSELPGVASVASVRKGSIDSVEVVYPGTGYSLGEYVRANSVDDGAGFTAVVSEINNDGGIEAVRVIQSGYNYGTLPTLSARETENTAILRAKSSTVGAIQSIRIADPFVGFTAISFFIDTEFGTGATLRPVARSQWVTREWEDRKGFIGENCTLIDSDKYQQFSYTLVSPIPAKEYDQFVDELLHPVGFIRNSEYAIATNDKLNLYSEFAIDVETP